MDFFSTARVYIIDMAYAQLTLNNLIWKKIAVGINGHVFYVDTNSIKNSTPLARNIYRNTNIHLKNVFRKKRMS